MTLVSFQFLAFVIILLCLYFTVPKKLQWVVLLIANFIFYALNGVRLIIYIVFTIITTYFAALCVEDANLKVKLQIKREGITSEEKKAIKQEGNREKRMLCTVALVCNFGLWIVLKYSVFFLGSFNQLLQWTGLSWGFPLPSFLLPLGISFYTFQAMGYLIDIYRGKYSAERNVLKFALFLSFFPHIVQGPFSRFNELGATLFEQHKFSYDRLCEGCRRILWGCFKKLLVADKIGIAVNEIFANYTSYSGVYIFAVAIFYGIQIYADFSGYMDIVCGVSHIMGIELAENFRQPYFAKSIEDFWRRWHITLGRWFRDYLFYPISMGKFAQRLGRRSREKLGAYVGKLIPSYFALIFVWTSTGLWHGANWTYLIWGFLNLFVIILSMQLEPVYSKVKVKLHIAENSRGWNVVMIARTFVLVCLFRFFSRASSVDEAVYMYKNMLAENNLFLLFNPTSLFPGMVWKDIIIFLMGTVCIFVVDVLNEMGKWDKIKQEAPILIRNVGYVAIIFAIILFAGGSSDLVGGFLYAQF